jgi:hypothetical protein
MKKIIASAGLVAVSTASLQAAAPGLSPMETAKPWSISATLRGFYDDNNLTLPSSADPEGSFGFEVRPSASLNLLPSEQTFIGLGYIYSLRWFEARDEDSADHSHELTLRADHRFSERYQINFEDSFVYAQEPEVIDEGAIVTAPNRRTDADAFRNRAAINFDAKLTDLIGIGLGYKNHWYNYDQEGAFSRSALLDRFEHYFRIEGKWQAREHLAALLGYQMAIFDYSSDEVIALSPVLGPVVGDDRDNVAHQFFVGVEQSLSSQFTAAARAGAQYTDYDHLEGDELSPWVDISGTYTYLPGSFLQFGFRHTRNATDITAPAADEVVTDQETSALFASINHRLTPRMIGSLIGQFQRSTFNNGAIDGDIDNFLLLGLNFEYRFNPNWSTELGYNFDRLDSDLPARSFTRNRVYAGVRATY